MEMAIILGVSLLAFAVLVVTNTGGHTLTGPAKVVSRRVRVGQFAARGSSGWNYLVTFRLADGEEIELYAFEHEYNALKEGLTGQLTWFGDSLSSFEPDMEVTL